jgi:serine/threonine protein kinase
MAETTANVPDREALVAISAAVQEGIETFEDACDLMWDNQDYSGALPGFQFLCDMPSLGFKEKGCLRGSFSRLQTSSNTLCAFCLYGVGKARLVDSEYEEAAASFKAMNGLLMRGRRVERANFYRGYALCELAKSQCAIQNAAAAGLTIAEIFTVEDLGAGGAELREYANAACAKYVKVLQATSKLDAEPGGANQAGHGTAYVQGRVAMMQGTLREAEARFREAMVCGVDAGGVCASTAQRMTRANMLRKKCSESRAGGKKGMSIKALHARTKGIGSLISTFGAVGGNRAAQGSPASAVRKLSRDREVGNLPKKALETVTFESPTTRAQNFFAEQLAKMHENTERMHGFHKKRQQHLMLVVKHTLPWDQSNRKPIRQFTNAFLSDIKWVMSVDVGVIEIQQIQSHPEHHDWVIVNFAFNKPALQARKLQARYWDLFRDPQSNLYCNHLRAIKGVQVEATLAAYAALHGSVQKAMDLCCAADYHIGERVMMWQDKEHAFWCTIKNHLRKAEFNGNECAKVYSVTYAGMPKDETTRGQQCALKSFRSTNNIDVICHEVLLRIHLMAVASHPHLLGLYFACYREATDECFLLTRWVGGDPLHALIADEQIYELRKRRNAPQSLEGAGDRGGGQAPAGDSDGESEHSELVQLQARLVKLWFQVATALEHCHQQGVVHQDVQPKNIICFVDEDDTSSRDRVYSFSAVLTNFELSAVDERHKAWRGRHAKSRAHDASEHEHYESSTRCNGGNRIFASPHVHAVLDRLPDVANLFASESDDIWSFAASLLESFAECGWRKDLTIADLLADDCSAKLRKIRFEIEMPPALRALLVECFNLTGAQAKPPRVSMAAMQLFSSRGDADDGSGRLTMGKVADRLSAIYQELTSTPLRKPTPQPPIAPWLRRLIHNNLGLALHAAGFVQQACKHYERALVASQMIRAAIDAAEDKAKADKEAKRRAKAPPAEKEPKKNHTAASQIQARIRGRNARRKKALERQRGTKERTAKGQRDDGNGHAAALNNLAVGKMQLSHGNAESSEDAVGDDVASRLFESAYHSYERAIAHTLLFTQAVSQAAPLSRAEFAPLAQRAQQAQRQLAQRILPLEARSLDRSALEGAFEFVEEIPIDSAVNYMPGQQLELPTKNPAQPTRITVEDTLHRRRGRARRMSVYSRTDGEGQKHAGRGRGIRSPVRTEKEGIDLKEMQCLVQLKDEVTDSEDDDLDMDEDEDREASVEQDGELKAAPVSPQGMALALRGFMSASVHSTKKRAHAKPRHLTKPRPRRRLRQLVLTDCRPAVHDMHAYADGQDGGPTCRCRYISEDAEIGQTGGGPPVWCEGTIESFKLSFEIEGRGLEYYMRWQRVMENEYGRKVLPEQVVLERLKKEILEATMLLDCPPLATIEINWGKVQKELQPEDHECSKWDSVTTFYPEALDEVLFAEYSPCNDEVRMVFPQDVNMSKKSSAALMQMGKMNQAVESMKLTVYPPKNCRPHAVMIPVGAMQAKFHTELPAGASLQAMRLMNMTCFEHRQLVEKQAALKRQDQEEARQVEDHAQAQYRLRSELGAKSKPLCDVEDERCLAEQKEKLNEQRLQTVLALAKLEADEATEEEEDKVARKRLLVLEEDFQLDDELFANHAKLSLLLVQEAEAQTALAKAKEKKEHQNREEEEKPKKKKKKGGGGVLMPSKYEMEVHRMRSKLAEFEEGIDRIFVQHPELAEKTKLEKMLNAPERNYKREERSDEMDATREAIAHCDARLQKAADLERKYAKLRTLMWLIEGTRRESDRLLQILHPGKKKKVKAEKGSRQTRSQIFAEQKQLEADEWHFGRTVDDEMVMMVEDIVLLMRWSTAEDEKKFTGLMERRQTALQADIDGEHYEVVKEEVNTPLVQKMRTELTNAYKSASFYAWRRMYKLEKQRKNKKIKGNRRYSAGQANEHKEQELRLRFLVTALKVEPDQQRQMGFAVEPEGGIDTILTAVTANADGGEPTTVSATAPEVAPAKRINAAEATVLEAVKGPYSLVPVYQYQEGQLIRLHLHGDWEWAQVVMPPGIADGSRHKLRVMSSEALLVCDLNGFNHSYALFHREQLQLQLWRYRLLMVELYGKTFDVLCGAARPWDVQTETAHRLLAKKSPIKGKWPRLYMQGAVLEMLCEEVGSRLRGSYRPSSVLITGPSASGKTTLLQNWACAICHTHTHVVPIFISVKQLCKILRQRRLAAGAALHAAAAADNAKKATEQMIDLANEANQKALDYAALKAKMFGASAALQAEAEAAEAEEAAANAQTNNGASGWKDYEEDEEEDANTVEVEPFEEFVPGCNSILTEFLMQQFLPPGWADANLEEERQDKEQKTNAKERAKQKAKNDMPPPPPRRRSSTDAGDSGAPRGLSPSPSQPVMQSGTPLRQSSTKQALSPSQSAHHVSSVDLSPSQSAPSATVDTTGPARKRSLTRSSPTSTNSLMPGGTSTTSTSTTSTSDKSSIRSSASATPAGAMGMHHSSTTSTSTTSTSTTSTSTTMGCMREHVGCMGMYLLLKQALLEKRVLFLVDGVDEAGPQLQSTVHAFIERELISAGHRVVITTRKDCTQASDFSKCLKLSLLPLFESQQEELLKKRIKDPTVRQETHALLKLPPYDAITTSPMMLSVLTTIASGVSPTCSPLPRGSRNTGDVKVRLQRCSLVFRAAFQAMIAQAVSKDQDHRREEVEDACREAAYRPAPPAAETAETAESGDGSEKALQISTAKSPKGGKALMKEQAEKAAKGASRGGAKGASKVGPAGAAGAAGQDKRKSIPKIEVPVQTEAEKQLARVREIVCSLQDVAFRSQLRRAGYDKDGVWNESGQYRTFSSFEAKNWDSTGSWRQTVDMVQRGLLPMIQKMPPTSFTSIAISPVHKAQTTSSRFKRAKTAIFMGKNSPTKKKKTDKDDDDEGDFGGIEGAEGSSGPRIDTHEEFQFMSSSFQEYMVAERMVMKFDEAMLAIPPLRELLRKAEADETNALERAQAGAGHKTRLKAVGKVRRKYHKIKASMVKDIEEALDAVRASLSKYLLDCPLIPMEAGHGAANVAIPDKRWRRVLLFVADILEARGEHEAAMHKHNENNDSEQYSFDHAAITPRAGTGFLGEDFTDFSNILLAKRLIFTEKLGLLSVQALAPWLRCNQSIEELHLNAAKLDCDLARRICNALRQNKELGSLFLHIGPAGSESPVLSELCHCLYLTHLDVSDTGAAERRRAAQAKEDLKKRRGRDSPLTLTVNTGASGSGGDGAVGANPLLPPEQVDVVEEVEDEEAEEVPPEVTRAPQHFPDEMFDLIVVLDSYCFDGNEFTNIEPGSIGHMLLFEYQNLKDQLTIDVGGRELHGIFPEAFYHRLFELEYFDFRLCRFENVKRNSIRGMFIYDFRNLHEQTEIDLKFLGLEGPLEDVSRLPNLQHLWLHGNRLQGTMPLSVLEMKARSGGDADAPMSPSKLMKKQQQQQQLPQSAPTAQHNSTAMQARSCFFNSNHGFQLPSVSIISHLGRDIVDLTMRDCSFTGELTDLAAAGLTRLKRLDFEDNHFTGTFPEGVYTMLFKLDYFCFRGSEFNISPKTLKGVVVHEMTTIIHLASLDLKHRHLRGPFPAELLAMLFKLEYFNFEGNDFDVDDETRQYFRSFHRVKYSDVESLPACALEGALDEKGVERMRRMGALSPQHQSGQGGAEESATGFNPGDKVKVSKQGGSTFGLTAIVTVADWVGRVKVTMEKGKEEKSYLPGELVLLSRSSDGRMSPKKRPAQPNFSESLPRIDSPMEKLPKTPSSQKPPRTPALKPPMTPDRRPTKGSSARPRSRGRPRAEDSSSGGSGGGSGGGGSDSPGMLPRM